MQADNSVGPTGGSSQLRDRNRGGIAGEDRPWLTDSVQFREKFLFQGEIFGDRFDDELHVVQPVELNHWMDEPQNRPCLMVREGTSFHGSFQTTADLAERLR